MAKEPEQLPASFTIQDILALMQRMNEDSDNRMMKAISEMKKPTAAEQKKLDDEEKRLARQREIRRSEMIIEEKSRLGAQQACMHKKKSRTGSFVSAWGGQVNSDGYWHPVCTVCQKVGPEVKAPQEWLMGGVNAQDADNVIMANMTEEILLQWQKQTGGPKPKTKPIGWTESEKKEMAAV